VGRARGVVGCVVGVLLTFLGRAVLGQRLRYLQIDVVRTLLDGRVHLHRSAVILQLVVGGLVGRVLGGTGRLVGVSFALLGGAVLLQCQRHFTGDLAGRLSDGAVHL